MRFRGPILVPEVAFWGFWGLVCIEKWSRNFDSGTQNAIFGTPKMAFLDLENAKTALKNGQNGHNFLGPQLLICAPMFPKLSHFLGFFGIIFIVA